jgi:hypothetical protein
LAISIGVLGGLATWVCLGMVTGLQIWAIFIAWGCFYHCGGGETGLKNTIICNIAGAVIAWIALLIIVNTGGIGGALPAGLWAGIVVGVTVAILVLLANVPAFATIPAMVYGYASVAAFFLLSAGASVTAADFTNPLVAVVVSMVIGAVLGWISQKIGVAMSAKAATA